MKLKIDVFCIWRDSEPVIYRTLNQLDSIVTAFKDEMDFRFYFYENDSKDNTASIIKDWMEEKNGGFICENLNLPKFGSIASIQRTRILADCRNKCKYLSPLDSDYSLLIDGDIEFSATNFENLLHYLQSFSDCVLATANIRQNIQDYTFNETKDSYYDVYPFRDKHGNTGMTWSFCPSYIKEDIERWKLGKPINCCSAFGGFAILKTKHFKNVDWSSSVSSEHVNFCFDLLKYGKIYIFPEVKVYTKIPQETIDSISLTNFLSAGKSQINHFQTYYNL